MKDDVHVAMKKKLGNQKGEVIQTHPDTQGDQQSSLRVGMGWEPRNLQERKKGWTPSIE